MNSVQIEQACDTLHEDLFNSVCQKWNNEKMTLPNHMINDS